MNELTAYAMLGEAGKGFFEHFGIDTKKAFDEALQSNPDLPADQRVHKAMNAMTEEVLTKAPVWMRINMLSHKIAHAKEKEIPESDIDWNKVNHYLTVNTNPADFNNFDPISSYETFYDAASASQMAGVDLIPWRREVCKDCGATFYLYQREIQYYLEKDLNLPKRCKDCRDYKRQNGTKRPKTMKSPAKVDKPTKTEAPHQSTAMEAAMRKAGLIK